MNLFGTPVLHDILSSEVVDRLKKNVQEYYLNGIETHSPWECDVYTTHELSNIFNNESFKWINDLLLQYIKKYLKEQNVNTIKLDNYYLVGWLNFYNKGQYQEIHNHVDYQSTISGSLIINCSEDPINAGRFGFYNNKTQDIKSHNLISLDNPSLAESWLLPSVPGSLLVFPSYLPHFVTQNNTDITRISLSFNLIST